MISWNMVLKYEGEQEMSDELKERVRKREAIGKTHNRILYGFIFVFFIGYIIFFTSSIWLPKPYEGVEVTPIGAEVTFSDRTVTIDSCRYSQKQKEMEIIVHVDNDSLDGINTYKWQVAAPGKQLKTEAVINDKDIVVLIVKNIPRRWTELSISANLEKEDYDKKSQFEPIKVYVNDKSVDSISNIKKHSKKEYIEIAATSKINSYKKEIAKIEKDENELKAMIDTANKTIAEKTEKMEYQTESEKMGTGDDIANLQAEKESIKTQLEETHKELEDYKQKIKLLEEYIKSL